MCAEKNAAARSTAAARAAAKIRDEIMWRTLNRLLLIQISSYFFFPGREFFLGLAFAQPVFF